MNEWLRKMARIYMPVYQYDCDTMKIIYAGYSPIKRNYCSRLILNRHYNHKFLGRYWYSSIPNLLNSLNLDIVVSEISQVTINHFQNCNGYIIPVWARMRINIDRPLSEICQRSMSDFPDVIRKIRKYNLTYEILSGKENLKDFYDKFYHPYMTKRHGEEAFLEDLDEIWDSSPSSLLMAIRENGIIAGMALITKSKDVLNLSRLGLLDGNIAYRSRGVIGAMYYFSIIEGQKMECKYFNVGGTRPFLTDGLTKYKLGLNAEFITDFTPRKEYLWFGFNEHSYAAKEFVQSNPFMHINRDFKLIRYGT